MRHCPKCEKDLDESNFKIRANGSYQAYCIECKKLIDREYQARKRAERNEKPKNETVLTKIETVSVKNETESSELKDYQKIIYCECDDWVPIEDHLPKESGQYLITQIGTNTFEQASKGVKVPVTNSMTFLGGHFLTSNVQAWRPMPEPYKHVKPTITPAPWYKKQPLGYKDRNDVEIREGDILNIRTVTRYNYENESPIALVWDPRRIGVNGSKIHEIGGDTLHGVTFSVLDQCEIIGSVHDLMSVESILTEEYFYNKIDLEKARDWLARQKG